MKPKQWGLIALATMMFIVLCGFDEGCDGPQAQQQTAPPQVHNVGVTVKTDASGMTTEQENVRQRLIEDNKPGAIKHLYVISPYSGQVILYSTVKGKVTSGGKRLKPEAVSVVRCGQNCSDLPGYDVDGHVTSEVLGDDGTYGKSGDYLYWWDVRGAYHQHYLTGGQIVTISDQPLPVKSIIINIEAQHE